MSQQLSLFPDLAQPAPATKAKPAQAHPSATMLRQAVAEYLPNVSDLPPAERPRARLEHYGSGALSTAELMAVLLGTPHQIHDAERLLATLDGLPGIAMANWTVCDACFGQGRLIDRWGPMHCWTCAGTGAVLMSRWLANVRTYPAPIRDHLLANMPPIYPNGGNDHHAR
jgi:hypothetical protein